MVRVESFMAFDGTLHKDETDCLNHERDKLAEELEELFSKVMHLEVRHSAKVAGILRAVEEDRAGLKRVVKQLHEYLTEQDKW